MEEWKTYKLSEIGNIVGGATPSTKIAENYDGDIPWITPKDLSDFSGRFIKYGERNITQQGFDSCSCQMLPKNSVLFSSRAPIGYVAIAAAPLCTNQGFKSVVPNEEIVDPRFLYYLLKFNKDRIAGMGSGTTFMEVSGGVMKNVEVSLPVIAIQKHIAEILSSIDDKIELNNRINHNLEEQAQALYKSWFVDFEPFKDGKFVESELGMIPEGWRVGPIYEYANVIYGAPYKSTLFNESGDGLPLIRIRDLKDCSPQFYSPEVLPNTEYVLKGDIVAGMDADFTPYIWKGNKGLLNQRVCKFIPTSDSISRYYIMMLVKPDLEFVSSYKVGTTVSHLGKSDIDKFTVILPPVEIVERYSRIADSILEKIVNNSTEAARLIEQRDSLLPQLMSGKLTC